MKNFSKVLIFVFMFSFILSSNSLVANDGPELTNLKKFKGTLGNSKGQWKKVNTFTENVYDFFTREHWKREIIRVERILQVEKTIPEKIIPARHIPERTDSKNAKYIVKEIGKTTILVPTTKPQEGFYEVKKDVLNQKKKIWRYRKVK